MTVLTVLLARLILVALTLAVRGTAALAPEAECQAGFQASFNRVIPFLGSLRNLMNRRRITEAYERLLRIICDHCQADSNNLRTTRAETIRAFNDAGCISPF